MLVLKRRDSAKQLTIEDCNVIHQIDENSIREGVGLVCTYCQLQTGYALRQPTLQSYANHWFDTHKEQGYTIVPTADAIERCRKEQRARYRAWLHNRFKRNTRIAAMVIPTAEKKGKRHKIKTRVVEMRELTAEERVII
jgi:hypothetical protein